MICVCSYLCSANCHPPQRLLFVSKLQFGGPAFFRRIAMCRSLDGNFGVLRIVCCWACTVRDPSAPSVIPNGNELLATAWVWLSFGVCSKVAGNDNCRFSSCAICSSLWSFSRPQSLRLEFTWSTNFTMYWSFSRIFSFSFNSYWILVQIKFTTNWVFLYFFLI